MRSLATRHAATAASHRTSLLVAGSGGVVSVCLPLNIRRCYSRNLLAPTLPTSLLHSSTNAYSRVRSNSFHPRFSRDFTSTAVMSSATSFYDFKPFDKKGQEVSLTDYKGKVVLVVNTASKCGFTPQYEGLEKLYKSVKEKNPDDFVILGFPCNQFGNQEPGTDDDIQNFCQVNYGVTFPIMQKIDVNGDKANPLYEWLKAEKPGLMGLKRIKWNFEKFLVGRDGKVKNRWASTSKPEALEKDIQAALNEKAQ